MSKKDLIDDYNYFDDECEEEDNDELFYDSDDYDEFDDDDSDEFDEFDEEDDDEDDYEDNDYEDDYDEQYTNENYKLISPDAEDCYESMFFCINDFEEIYDNIREDICKKDKKAVKYFNKIYSSDYKDIVKYIKTNYNKIYNFEKDLNMIKSLYNMWIYNPDDILTINNDYSKLKKAVENFKFNYCELIENNNEKFDEEDN